MTTGEKNRLLAFIKRNESYTTPSGHEYYNDATYVIETNKLYEFIQEQM